MNAINREMQRYKYEESMHKTPAFLFAVLARDLTLQALLEGTAII